eukprot:CAMPEP_0117578210 /NCGR_PEP_ID=MMETSP0784-20121206/63867_1 /TAXON_ID=39447 /ORGANISM="" /LENGTH=35 /DNA_ID= /DNA_START= /DNA_END= /DNA_ORIENTATION=
MDAPQDDDGAEDNGEDNVCGASPSILVAGAGAGHG